MKRQMWCRIVSFLVLLAIITVLPACKKGIWLRPGSSADAPTLDAGGGVTIDFNFPQGTVSFPAYVTINAVSETELTNPFTANLQAVENLRLNSINYNPANVFIAAFTINVSPDNTTVFNNTAIMRGNVPTSIAAGTTMNLAKLKNNAWEDVLTLLVGANGAFTQNFVSVALPGILGSGTYVLYIPAPGTSTAISNLGIVLISDDGNGRMNNGSAGYIQVVHLYDANQEPLPTPLISNLNYNSDNQSDIDCLALTPVGSQGIMVDRNFLYFFSQVQTGSPIKDDPFLDVSTYGLDGDSVAIMPNGDAAVVSLDSDTTLLLVSGILSGNPQPTKLIDVPDQRDGVVISNDGKVLLARGFSGLTVFSIASVITPPSVTVVYLFTKINDLTSLGTSGSMEDGRNGMALSPIDSSRAVLINPSIKANSALLVTGLPNSPSAGTPVTLTGANYVYSVAITPDGTTAIVGTDSGIIMLSGVKTGTLAMVGSIYAPTYTDTASSSSAKLEEVKTLGVTLDGRYVVVCDSTNAALLVIPITATGFSAPVGVLTGIAVPSADQLIIH